MALNWTFGVFFGILGMAGNVLGLVVLGRQIQKGSRLRIFYLSFMVWASGGLSAIFYTFSFLRLDPVLTQWSIFLLSIEGFLLLLNSDCISREFVDPVKLVIYTLVASIKTFLILTNPNAFFVMDFANGETGIGTDPSALVMIMVYLTYSMPSGIYLYNVVRMNQQAPLNLKKYTRAYLLGVSIMLIGSTVILMTVGSTWVPGLHLLCIGIGTVILALTIAEHPKIAFILPFKALRLTVLDIHSGIPFFQHTWSVGGRLGHEDLYAGMLQGVNAILKESLQRGDVQEIKMAQAVILVHRDEKFPVACTIVATKASRTLRDALKLFANKFNAQFSQFFVNPSYVDVFTPAESLVAECFPFVPDYD